MSTVENCNRCSTKFMSNIAPNVPFCTQNVHRPSSISIVHPPSPSSILHLHRPSSISISSISIVHPPSPSSILHLHRPSSISITSPHGRITIVTSFTKEIMSSGRETPSPIPSSQGRVCLHPVHKCAHIQFTNVSSRHVIGVPSSSHTQFTLASYWLRNIGHT